jgi:hypothetical protein
MTNLADFLEYATILSCVHGESSYYYDKRYGEIIPESQINVRYHDVISHNNYADVIMIKDIDRVESNFIVTVIAMEDEGADKIVVSYDHETHKFDVDQYNPVKIISEIINRHMGYLIMQKHPKLVGIAPPDYGIFHQTEDNARKFLQNTEMKSRDDISMCIQAYIMNNVLTYYDARTGDILDENQIHTYYLNCAPKNVMDFKSIIDPIHIDGYTVSLNIMVDDNTVDNITVIYNINLHTFEIFKYNPVKIIKAILHVGKRYYIANYNRPLEFSDDFSIPGTKELPVNGNHKWMDYIHNAEMRNTLLKSQETAWKVKKEEEELKEAIRASKMAIAKEEGQTDLDMAIEMSLEEYRKDKTRIRKLTPTDVGEYDPDNDNDEKIIQDMYAGEGEIESPREDIEYQDDDSKSDDSNNSVDIRQKIQQSLALTKIMDDKPMDDKPTDDKIIPIELPKSTVNIEPREDNLYDLYGDVDITNMIQPPNVQDIRLKKRNVVETIIIESGYMTENMHEKYRTVVSSGTTYHYVKPNND